MNETTAQDAPGSTITVSDDLRVAVLFALARSRAHRRPWTLPDPWTPRTRPPVLGKPRTVFHR